jgi:hypothetical protein
MLRILRKTYHWIQYTIDKQVNMHAVAMIKTTDVPIYSTPNLSISFPSQYSSLVKHYWTSDVLRVNTRSDDQAIRLR